MSTFFEVNGLHNSSLCIEVERLALLNIKKSLKDPAGCLSSWVGRDCCTWNGIECNDQTGHVVKLDLRSTSICSINWSPLRGELSPSLVDLKHLSYLDISKNDFQGIPIPKFLGSLTKLNYLNLCDANFSGMIPSHLGNLSNLQHLGLSNSLTLYISDLSWLSQLTSLQYLDMSNVNMNQVSNGWLNVVNMIPSLVELHFIGCNLGAFPQPLLVINLTSLSVLDLSWNNFNCSIPQFLFNFSALTDLQVSYASLRGPIDKVGWRNLCNLETLDLSVNHFLTGNIQQIIMALSSCNNKSLEEVDISHNQLSGNLPEFLGNFNNLKDIGLSSNSISGPIPSSIGNLSNLETLSLNDNVMNGTIPKTLGQLTKLITLDLISNSWEGTITNIHFQNLTNLISFTISSVKNTVVFNVTHDWTPFDLIYVEIIDCEVGPTFPIWLKTSKGIQQVILQNVGISEAIPNWFWNLSSQINELDLSYNKIIGNLPKTLKFSTHTVVNLASNRLEGSFPLWYGVMKLYLGNNSLSGPIPTNFGHEMSLLDTLDLSINLFNGIIPSSITMLKNLTSLDLSYNNFTGEIPLNWTGMHNLCVLDLSYNSLSGVLPASICSETSLSVIQLSNNNLQEDLSLALQNCTRLYTLDLGGNKFFGSIPKAIGKKLALVSELRLRGNALTGSIPKRLCHLSNLHLLDLAENNLSGPIPACLGDVLGFKLAHTYFQESASSGFGCPVAEHMNLVVKGIQYEYFELMFVVNIIDLSKNNLSGLIPENLTELSHLGTLNLSWNSLTGNMPKNMASLTYLEALDLSHNYLSGPIPSSMSSMTFLSKLNLSYNNLSGQIPTANQFDTFDPSSYEGNPNLCGPPLSSSCTSSTEGDGETKPDDASGDEDNFEKFWFIVSMGLGYIVGFWIVFGSLIIKSSWRYAYFRFLDNIKDKLWGDFKLFGP